MLSDDSSMNIDQPKAPHLHQAEFCSPGLPRRAPQHTAGRSVPDLHIITEQFYQRFPCNCWKEGTSRSERACETPLGVKLAYCCGVVPAPKTANDFSLLFKDI